MEAPALLFRNYLVCIGARRYMRAPADSNYLNQ